MKLWINTCRTVNVRTTDDSRVQMTDGNHMDRIKCLQLMDLQTHGYSDRDGRSRFVFGALQRISSWKVGSVVGYGT